MPLFFGKSVNYLIGSLGICSSLVAEVIGIVGGGASGGNGKLSFCRGSRFICFRNAEWLKESARS